LSDKSLIASIEQPDGSVRFRMLGVVREFALEILAETDEFDKVNRAFADHYLALAEEAAKYLQCSDSVKWLDRLESEHDNLRSVLQWSLEHDAETAVRLAAALRFFWLFHSHVVEGHRWLKLAFEKSSGLSHGVRAKLLNGLGVGARIRGDYADSRDMHKRALAESTRAGDKREMAFSNRGLGAVAGRQGDAESAQRYYERTLELFRELNDASEIAYSLGSLGGLARLKGQNETARSLLEESLAMFRRLGQKERVITNLFGLGVIAYREDDCAVALSLFKEALLIARELKDKLHLSDLLDGIAAVAGRRNPEQAARLAGIAAQLRSSIGYELAPAERRFRDDYLNKLKLAIDEERFAELHRQGCKLVLDEAIDAALAEASV